MAPPTAERRPRPESGVHGDHDEATSRIPRRVLGRWRLTHWPSPDPARRGRVLVSGRDAGHVLMNYGLHPVWSGLRKGWALDDDHLPDVAAIAAMKTLGYRLVHLDGTDCLCAVAPRENRRLDIDPSEDACDCADLGPLPDVLVDLGAVDVEHFHRRTYTRGWSA